MAKSKTEVAIEAKFPRNVVEIIDGLIRHGLYKSRAEAVAALVRAHLDYILDTIENFEGAVE
jgi:Arc/MetJ-type ribon-helix-helix transcriptional regulator